MLCQVQERNNNMQGKQSKGMRYETEQATQVKLFRLTSSIISCISFCPCKFYHIHPQIHTLLFFCGSYQHHSTTNFPFFPFHPIRFSFIYFYYDLILILWLQMTKQSQYTSVLITHFSVQVTYIQHPSLSNLSLLQPHRLLN